MQMKFTCETEIKYQLNASNFVANDLQIGFLYTHANDVRDNRWVEQKQISGYFRIFYLYIRINIVMCLYDVACITLPCISFNLFSLCVAILHIQMYFISLFVSVFLCMIHKYRPHLHTNQYICFFLYYFMCTCAISLGARLLRNHALSVYKSNDPAKRFTHDNSNDWKKNSKISIFLKLVHFIQFHEKVFPRLFFVEHRFLMLALIALDNFSCSY